MRNRTSDSSGRKPYGTLGMLIRTIEKFLRRYEMPPTKFGRLAAHDPRFVLDLRMGRDPRSATEARILGFIAGFEAAQADAGKDVAHVQ